MVILTRLYVSDFTGRDGYWIYQTPGLLLGIPYRSSKSIEDSLVQNYTEDRLRVFLSKNEDLETSMSREHHPNFCNGV